MPPTATAESWNPPDGGYWRRDFRLTEWVGAPVSASFASWLLPRLEQGFSDAVRDEFGFGMVLPAHVIVNGWYFTSEPRGAGTAGAMLRHPVRMARLGLAMATFAGHPERAERVMAEPTLDAYRATLLPAHRRRVASAEQRVAEAAPEGAIAVVDELAWSTGTLMLPMVQTLGFAGKAEFALAAFCSKHLRDRVDVTHLDLLSGASRPRPRPAHAVASLDWIEPLAGSLDDGADEGIPVDDGRAAAALASCRDALAGSRRVARFEELVVIARRWAPVREEMAGEFTEAWPCLRTAALRLGEHLAGRGVLDRPEQVFHLERTEVAAAVAGDRTVLSAVADERAARREARRHLDVPLAIGRPSGPWKHLDRYLAVLRDEPEPGAAVLARGLPTSAGRAVGRVRVVRGPEDFAAFRDGEVLVAPLTAPAWTPLFGRAAAVVTDTGSPFAHASLIAREYGIPAVVGTGNATAVLRDGQHVLVDGSTGTVGPAPHGSHETGGPGVVPAGDGTTRSAVPAAGRVARATGVLDLVEASDPAVAGGKAAALAVLAASGFPVPPGVVVPPGVEVDGPGLWQRLGGGPLAVRSSAVAEDGADASLAGVYESVLGVDGPDALSDAVAAVRASAEGARSAAYGHASPMAVLVQPMVHALAAGAAFTADPLTGARDRVLVGAVAGLGASLVDGSVTGDEWVVTDVPRPVRDSGACTADLVAAVADLARRVEARTGSPRDIEWAWDGETLWLLQARPMTALPPPA